MIHLSSSNKNAISPTRANDFPGWYQEVVKSAELAEMAHVRGCMVIKPWGYGLWERIRDLLDVEIKSRGHENAYFPMFIPLSYIQQEAQHVEGFAKEMAVVTHHRLEQRDGALVPGGKLDEPIVVRPTSEAIIGASMSQWIQSYRDLPLLLNQWANVVRWEMRPRVFLRTSEFLWQEGHTAHASSQEAMEETMEMFRVYETFARDKLAIPVISGEKSQTERFPGADRSFSIEAMMQDGKALQAGTSHYLGQNFAKSASIKFLDSQGELKFAFTTSWGVSTRLIGALIMAHGDDDGIRLPPTIAPSQIVIVPISREETTQAAVLDYAKHIKQLLEQAVFSDEALRVRLDDRPIKSVDKKWQWIKKGVPIVIEVGMRDIESNSVSVRSRLSIGETNNVGIDALAPMIENELVRIQSTLFKDARDFLDDHILCDNLSFESASSYLASGKGFLLAKWCGSSVCEVGFRDQGATLRCLPSSLEATGSTCVVCSSPASQDAIFAQSY